MRKHPPAISNALPLALLWIAACGGSAPPAEAPAPKSAPAAESTKESAPPAAAEPAKPAETAAPAAPAAPAEEKRMRTPREVIGLESTTFVLVWDESDPHKTAEASCAKETDPHKHAKCMDHARSAIDVDGYQFLHDTDSQLWCIGVRRKGGSFVPVHKVRCDFGDDSDSSVTFKVTGRDEGSGHWAKVPTEMKFDVPNDYRIVYTDPKLGKLVYEARAGSVHGQ
jgi:hypothetical protein